MKLFSTPTLLISIGLCLSACGGDKDPPIDVPGDPTPRAVNPIPGGGTSGGAIDGVLTVFVQNEANVAIADASVQVDIGGKVSVKKTDAAGRVDFWDDGLAGTAPIHVYHPEYGFASIYGFNASVITVGLDAVEIPEAPAPQVGTVTGTITGWDMLAANTQTSARIAQIFAIGADIGEVAQRARPGTVTPAAPAGLAYNQVINGSGQFPMWNDYQLDLDARAEALIAFGGTFTVGATPPVSITHMGIRTDLDVAVDEVRSNQNLEISHALDQAMSVTITNPPALATTLAVFGVELGSGVRVPVGSSEITAGAAAQTGPALTGALASGEYFSLVSFAADERVGDLPRSSVVAVRKSTSTMFAYDDLLPIVGAPSAAGRTLAATPAAGADLHFYELIDEANGKSLWHVTVKGDLTASVTLPIVPEGVTDRLTGSLRLVVLALDLGDVDLNGAKFEDLDASFRGSSTSRANVNF